MAVNTDLEAPPIVDYGQPTPESAVTARSLIPQTNTPGTLPIPAGAIGPGMNGNMPNILGMLGLNEGDLVKQYQATQAGQELLQANAAQQARLDAYKAANPGASDFQAAYYGGSDENRARLAAMYPGTFGGLHKSMYYSGTAPQEGQSTLDYLLANNGQMPETKVKEGPGLGGALLNAAMLASAGLGVGALGNLFLGGATAAGAGAAGAGAAGAGSIIPSTVAGLIPTGTALGAGSAAGALGATLGTAGAATGLGTLASALAPTVSELVITGSLGGGMSPAIAAALGLGGTTAAGTILSGGSGSNTLTGDPATDVVQPSQPDPNTVSELEVIASKPTPGPTLVPPINPFQPGLTSMPNPTLDPPAPPADDGTTVSELEVVAARPTPVPPIPLVPPINPFQPGLTTMPNVTLQPPAPADDGTTVSELEVVAAKPTPVTPVVPGPTINPFQPGLKPMPDFPLDPPAPTDTPDVSQPDKPTTQPPKNPTSDTKTTTTMTSVLPPTVPGSTGVDRPIPTLKSFTPTGGSESFNLNQFLASMTTPRATANLGNVSPFSGGGVGPGAGPLNLKGSSAPDIYPWVQDAGG